MRTVQITATGAVTYWTPGKTQRRLIEPKLTALGLEAYVPAQRSDDAALKHALGEYAAQRDKAAGVKDRKRILQPLKDRSVNGYEVAVVDQDASRNDYTNDFSAKVVEGVVTVSNGWADVNELQTMYAVAKSEIPPESVGASLVQLTRHLGALKLRESGGVYWLSEDNLPVWISAAEAFEETCEKCKVYRQTVIVDEPGIRALRDALTDEITAETIRLATEITSGLGTKAMEARKHALLALDDKITAYEGIFQEGLERLHAIVGGVQEAATLALLAM